MNKLTALIGLTLLTTAPLAYAEVSDEEFQKMQEQLGLALERINELEQREAVVDIVQQAEIGAVAGAEVAIAEQVAENTARIDKQSWTERVKLKGDFRYRYQADEGKKLLDDANQPEDEDTRNRQRIRARLAVVADLPKDVEVGIGLATGGDDPVSANQTLGGSGSSKSIQLDLAYADWEFAEGANLEGGKFKNRFVRAGKNGLMWDSDWRPEGFDLRYANETFYATGLGTWLEGDSDKDGNGFNYGVQAGFTPSFGVAQLNVGAGYWKFKADGNSCFDSPSNSGGNGEGRGCFGNTAIDKNGNLVKGGTPDDDDTTIDESSSAFYIMDYAPVEIYALLDFGTSFPFGFFADFAKNLDATAVPTTPSGNSPSAGKKLDTAYAVGVTLGKAKKTGSWHIKALYQDKEADSVLGLLTDSDFGGGGTDSKGYVLQGRYMLTEQIYLNANYLAAERQDSNGIENGSAATSNPYDVNTLQLDIQFKSK
jgi:hypothetical protein